MSNDLTQKNAELGRFLFCERYTLQPVKNSLYIAEGQDLKRGAVVDVNGVLVGTNSLMPYAVLETDCDTRAKGAFSSVFVKGEFNFDKLFFADGLSKEDLDNIVYNGNGTGLVFKPYTYDEGFSSAMVPAGTSESNPLMNAADTELMIAKMMPIAENTLRFCFSKVDYDPKIEGVSSSGTWKKVSKYANIWDWTRSGTSFINSFLNAFASADNLVSLIAAGDTSAVTNMGSMFRGCTSLTEISLFDTSAVTNMDSMFRGCTSLAEIPLFNTSVVSDMGSMFSSCTSLTEIPLFDTSAVTNMNSMFSGCTSLVKIPLFDTSAVTSIGYMFINCRNVEEGSLALYQQASSQTTPPTSYANTFYNCGIDTTTGASELAQIPASWGGTAAG